MPATIEITEFDRGNVFLSFGDIEAVDPPNIIKGGKGLYQTSGDGTNAQAADGCDSDGCCKLVRKKADQQWGLTKDYGTKMNGSKESEWRKILCRNRRIREIDADHELKLRDNDAGGRVHKFRKRTRFLAKQ